MIQLEFNKKLLLVFLFSLLVCFSVFMINRVNAASGTNVALNKAATASCSMIPYSPDKAVDGSTEALSRWYCATGMLGGEKWLQIDLDSPYTIDGYSVIGMGYLGNGWGGDLNPRDFRLQKSADGSVWVDADTVTNNSSSVITRDVTSFQSRYVRLFVDYGNQYNDTWTSVMDFQIFGQALSSNASLSGLTLSSGALNETFSGGTLTYTQTVGNAVSSLTVTPTAEDAAATVQVKTGAEGTYMPVPSGTASSELPLVVGENTVYVQVTAADNSTITYTVTVTRLSSNADLSELMLSDSTLTPVFAGDTTHYTTTVSEAVYKLNLTATAADSKAKINVNGTAVTGPVELNTDELENEIQILVTAEDPAYTKLYTIDIIKLSANADIRFLHYGTIPLQRSLNHFYLEVSNEVSSLSLNLGLTDPRASISVTGADYTANTIVISSLKIGLNKMTIAVTAQDGTAKSFDVIINRTAAADKNKDGIRIDELIELMSQLTDVNFDNLIDSNDARFILFLIEPIYVK